RANRALAVSNDDATAGPAGPGIASGPPRKEVTRASERVSLDRLFGVLAVVGLGFLSPLIRLCRGENPRAQLRDLWKLLGLPLLAIAIFLFAWSRVSATIHTSLGQIPGPSAVLQQAQS